MEYTTNPDGTILLPIIDDVPESIPSATDLYRDMTGILASLRRAKPNDRSELDRRYAVTITKMEDVFAYFSTFVMSKE